VNYPLESLQKFMPHANLTREKVQFVYSGFRPLFSSGAGADPGRASREDHIELAASGLVSVIGGKLTTARLMAIRVLKAITARSGVKAASRCRTDVLSIGGTNADVAEGVAYWGKQCPKQADCF